MMRVTGMPAPVIMEETVSACAQPLLPMVTSVANMESQSSGEHRNFVVSRLITNNSSITNNGHESKQN